MMTPVSTPSPHWHILGLGAIGGLMACRMRQAGFAVSACPAPGDTSEHNIHLTLEEKHSVSDFNIPVSTDGPIGFLLLTTKAQQSAAALAPHAHRFTADTVVVVLQNGLGIQEWLVEHYPQLQIVAATTTEGANRPRRHHVRHAGEGTTWLGPWRPDDDPAAQAVFAQWSLLGMNIVFDADIAQRLWEKLVINCAINPLTALLDCRNGELVAQPETRAVMQQVVTEVSEVMQAAGRQIDSQALYQRVLDVADRTGENISSMLQDQRSGRETEIDFINGYIARRGAALGVPTPTNDWLANQVKARHHHSTRTLSDTLRAITGTLA